MKQQLILEKIKKSSPSEQSMDAENFAPSFCLPPKKLSNQNQAQQQLVQQSQDDLHAKNSNEKHESNWPTAGSIVKVRLDTETVMTGIVTNDGAIADALRATGFIGVQTSDGQLIEVPYPDKNVFVKQMVRKVDVDKLLSSSSASSSLTASEVADVKLKVNFSSSIIENANGIESTSKMRIYGDEEAMSLSSWPTDVNSSHWNERGRTLIGKRLSKKTGPLSAGALDSDDDKCTDGGNKRKNYDDNSDNDHDNDDDDDDDDVQWVGGHETLTQKKKKKTHTAGEESEESDEEEIHWQTPADSAEIDIEVCRIVFQLHLENTKLFRAVKYGGTSYDS